MTNNPAEQGNSQSPDSFVELYKKEVNSKLQNEILQRSNRYLTALFEAVSLRAEGELVTTTLVSDLITKNQFGDLTEEIRDDLGYVEYGLYDIWIGVGSAIQFTLLRNLFREEKRPTAAQVLIGAEQAEAKWDQIEEAELSYLVEAAFYDPDEYKFKSIAFTDDVKFELLEIWQSIVQGNKVIIESLLLDGADRSYKMTELKWTKVS